MRPTILFLILSAFFCQCNTRSKEETKLQQYFVQGEKLYEKHCSNCHQSNGKGLGRVFPPVDESDYIENNFQQVICLIKNGIEGEIVVNGIRYNKKMPAMPELTDLEIAEIATFLYNSWNRKKGLISVQEVNPILQKCDSASR